MRLQLGQEWILGELIDGGGFGKVYAAKSAGHESAVAKLVPKAPGAEREMLFVDLGKARNIVPIIDSGETEDSWALVMPRAETSLRQHLRKVAGLLGTADAVAVLADIAVALADLDGRVVHRDLKPENTLLLNGHWCLADFGISQLRCRARRWLDCPAQPSRNAACATSCDLTKALGVMVASRL